MEIQTVPASGHGRLDCRDPMSYIKTNEVLQHVWLPYIANLGGGYIGLAPIRVFLHRRGEERMGWLFDYDPTVVRSMAYRHPGARERDPEDFVACFAPMIAALLT